ncbi:MAG: S49 family peptidase [Maricaulaceae bacterium]|jgi:signal peptide peptidase SppA
MLSLLRKVLPFLPEPSAEVPLVRLEGVIGRSGPTAGRTLSLESIEKALDKAFRVNAPAVALVINSPGGSPVQSRMIHDRIRALAKEKDRRVIAFCEDAAASGGYMIAIAADEIWADASSIVGSIGVVSMTFGAKEAFDKLGLERRVYTAGKHKVRLDPFLEEDPEDVAWLKALQDDLHVEFIDLVRARRGSKLVEGENLFEGEIWLGRKAKSLGIVDDVGHVREVLKDRYGADVRIRAISPLRGLGLSRLLGAGVEMVIEAVLNRLMWMRLGL